NGRTRAPHPQPHPARSGKQGRRIRSESLPRIARITQLHRHSCSFMPFVVNHPMTFHDILFWLFSIAMLLCGLGVITNRNPVNSAVFLVLLFVCMAGLFVLLEAFFLAVIQILVYAGAVMVLFLFVIMLLDLKPSALRRV